MVSFSPDFFQNLQDGEVFEVGDFGGNGYLRRVSNGAQYDLSSLMAHDIPDCSASNGFYVMAFMADILANFGWEVEDQGYFHKDGNHRSNIEGISRLEVQDKRVINRFVLRLLDARIKHKIYKFEDGGRVESLGYRNADGQDATVGVIIPGTTREFDFGVAERTEHVYVLDGQVGIITGQLVGTTSVLFEAGEPVRLGCKGPVAYHCLYK